MQLEFFEPYKGVDGLGYGSPVTKFEDSEFQLDSVQDLEMKLLQAKSKS